MTAVPQIIFAPTGLQLPTEPAILEGVQTDMNGAFGGNLNPSLETPQGQMATSQTAIIADKNAQIAFLAQQTDPDFATGRFQDAIGKFYFMTRKPALPTTTQVACLGAQGTIIPVGATCVDSLGNKYLCSEAGTIPVGGTITLPFACSVTGPVPLSNNDLSIYQTITGWNSVTNNTVVVGVDVESRADFEYRRQMSVALNSQGALASVVSNVFAVDGVTDVYPYENSTGSPITIGTTAVGLVAHSLYVCVAGGVDAEIAQAIWEKKDPGCDMNGTTTVLVTDTVLYQYPYPSYTIKFQRPAALPIKFLVQLQNNPQLPSNIVQLVQNAIIAAFNGDDGGQRARIGATLLAGRYYSGVALTSQYANILALFIDTGGGTFVATSVVAGADELPTLTASDITVSLI